MVQQQKRETLRAHLNGNFVRRKLPPTGGEYAIHDNKLPGFGIRVRSNGKAFWFVRPRRRGRSRRIMLGSVGELDAVTARKQAKKVLVEAALDGLPRQRTPVRSPTFSEFVEVYWGDIARGWKPSTVARNWHAWTNMLMPEFGPCRVASVTREDVVRWRDGCAGADACKFNRSVPVLSSLFQYAEALKITPKGSNPCRGIPRYKTRLLERYLTSKEFRRLGRELAEAETEFPAQVAIIRLLLFTGARISEIRDLQWAWVKPPRLMLPDSKTGPKVIYLNAQAIAILKGVKRIEGCPFVFPNATLSNPITVERWWVNFRRQCALPDVRIHDLRHSFASVAIAENVPLATIGALLGHVLPETTARYAHLADDHIADAAQRVSGSLAQTIGVSR
ncbi:MAG: tyrosine-type recombinase/integrase [Parvularcula sp.]|jgi:integrase|nr:tyrosine-type recombinase/integrase [Parvularcula sp.]